MIESAMMRGGGVSHAPRVCMLPDELTSRALKHMTGYPTVQHKLTCARTMGLHQVTGLELGVGLGVGLGLGLGSGLGLGLRVRV